MGVVKEAFKAGRWRWLLRRSRNEWQTLSPPASHVKLNVDTRPALERLLLENIASFWRNGFVDEVHGGYHLHHDIQGRDLGPYPKYVISQARLAWFFSCLARSPYGTREDLEIARHGIEGLEELFLDREHGGYYWRREMPGETVDAADHTRKDLCAQAYVIYAQCEYFLASGDDGIRACADRLFELIQSKCLDRRQGGYFELLEGDWSIPRPDCPNFHGGLTHAHKSFSCQVHVLEALTSYHRVRNSESAGNALGGLLDNLLTKMIHGPSHILSSVHDHAWRVLLRHHSNKSIYGHDLEFAWLVADAMGLLGRDIERNRHLFESLFANAVYDGMDSEHGGFFFSGRIGGSARQHTKLWWAQAEGMLCAMYLHRHFGDGLYADVFNRTLQWITRRQADWQHGEWFDRVRPTGAPEGGKAGRWKSAYHSGRSVLHSLALLTEVEATGP